MFTPIVGLLGSPMHCIAMPHSIPVNPESELSNHWMFSIWLSPMESRVHMASTRSPAESLSMPAPFSSASRSPRPAETPMPPTPARPQLFRMPESCSASIPRPLR